MFKLTQLKFYTSISSLMSFITYFWDFTYHSNYFVIWTFVPPQARREGGYNYRGNCYSEFINVTTGVWMWETGLSEVMKEERGLWGGGGGHAWWNRKLGPLDGVKYHWEFRKWRKKPLSCTRKKGTSERKLTGKWTTLLWKVLYDIAGNWDCGR